MRVLAYLLAYPPQRWIGSEVMTSRLLEALAEAGHEVTAATEGCREAYERRGVRVIPRRDISLSQTAHNDYDLFITHPEIAEHLYLRIKGTPYIAVVHNTRDVVHAGLLQRRPLHVIYNSEAMAAELDPHFTIPYTVIRPPLVLDKRVPHARLSRQFITAVNLTEDKGGDVFWWLAEQRPHMQFLAVLGGYGEQIIRERDNVWLTGQTPDMSLVWAQSKAFVSPTRHESYGMAAVEAAAAGVPVVITDLPGPREALGDVATYIPDDDPGLGWLEAVDEAWADERLFRRRSERARERGAALAARTVEDMRTWITVAESLADCQ